MEFPQDISDFLKEPNYMVIATVGKDGSPHQTLVWFDYQDGQFKISTTTSRMKYKKKSISRFIDLRPRQSLSLCSGKGKG